MLGTKGVSMLIALFFFFGLGFAAKPAEAQVAASAKHKVISTEMTPQGVTTTVNITMTNNSNISLSGVSLRLMRDKMVHSIADNAFTFQSLPAGAQVQLQLTLTTLTPVPQGLPLMFHGQATDSNGVPIAFAVISEPDKAY